MKLKLNTSQTGTPSQQTPGASATPTTAGGGLKLTFSKPADSSSTTEQQPQTPQQPKPKRKYTKKDPDAKAANTPKGKKREREDDGEGDFAKPPLAKKPTLTLTSTKTPKASTGKAAGTTAKKAKGTGKPKPIIRLKSGGLDGGGAQSPSTPTGATRLKIKAKGKPPPRPLGVGYDSECEDAEEDPSMEEHLIFRMEPGPDCEYIKKAIEERMLGAPLSAGGADVNMRFFDKNGRRAVVSVQGRHYAAILVDLPCIIESMKSWDKRGWWKSADICQMLMVIGKVDKEDDAKEAPLPSELDQETWQWPNGLTPPMYNVRKRRFRKRLSNRTIEAAEEEVNRLLKKDEEAITSRGSTSWEIINPRGEEESEASDQGENGEDVDMFDEEDLLAQLEDDEVDNEDELARQLEGLDGDDMDDVDVGVTQEGENDGGNATEDQMPAVSTPVGIEGDSMVIDSPTVAEASTEFDEGEEGEGEAEEGDEDELVAAMEEASEEENEDQESSDDDDDDDNAADAEEDEDAREKAQQLNDIKSELANALKQIRQRDEQLRTVTAPIIRNKILGQRQEFERIAQVKRQELGLGEDDEVDLEGLDADDDA